MASITGQSYLVLSTSDQSFALLWPERNLLRGGFVSTHRLIGTNPHMNELDMDRKQRLHVEGLRLTYKRMPSAVE